MAQLGGDALNIHITNDDATLTLPGDSLNLYIENLDALLSSNLPAHATTHEDGGADEIQTENLPSLIVDTDLVLQPDGTGGVEFVAYQSASEIVAGKIEIATQAETNTGTDDTRALTPLKLTNSTPIGNSVSHIADTVNPHATDVGNLGTGTLAELNTAITNATLADDITLVHIAGIETITGAKTFTTNDFNIQGNADTNLLYVVNATDKIGIGTNSPPTNASKLTLADGILTLAETTTPTADTNYGKIYTKNDNKLYFQDGAGVEHELVAANASFSEFALTGGTVFTINGSSEIHGYVGMTGDETTSDISQHTGAIVDLTGATFATANGGASTQITGVAHGLSADDIITINGSSTAGYNIVAQVEVVGGASDFTIDIAFIDNPGTEGFFQHADHFEIETGAAGTYQIVLTASGTMAVSAATCEFGIYLNKTLKHKVSRRFTNASDVGAWALTGLVTTVVGDELWFSLNNITNSNNIDIDDISFNIHRL